jgi:hypothetical protein
VPEVEKTASLSIHEVQALVRGHPEIAAGVLEDIEEQVIGKGAGVVLTVAEEEKAGPVVASEALGAGDPNEAPPVLDEAVDDGTGLTGEGLGHQPVEINAPGFQGVKDGSLEEGEEREKPRTAPPPPEYPADHRPFLFKE